MGSPAPGCFSELAGAGQLWALQVMLVPTIQGTDLWVSSSKCLCPRSRWIQELRTDFGGRRIDVTISAGSEIDAWCTSCRMTLNHRVVAMVEGVAKRVLCLTCNKQHNYRAPKREGVAPARSER